MCKSNLERAPFKILPRAFENSEHGPVKWKGGREWICNFVVLLIFTNGIVH